MKRKELLLATIFTAILMIFSYSNQADAFTIDRIAGEDRYETAVEISKQGWPDGATAVLIARGKDFPDALAGAPLAYQKGGPILLTKSGEIPRATLEEIDRLNPSEIVILGGPNAVSRQVEGELAQRFKMKTTRVGGEDRYETAAIISGMLPNKTEAIIVSGEKFPDAMTIAPYASRKGIPLLLTKRTNLPPETADALTNRNNTILVGGTTVIDEQVESKLPSSWRIAGEDRYATSAEVARGLPMGNAEEAFVATGLDFADGLTGAVLAATSNDEILLTERDYVSNAVKIAVHERGLENFHILGGYRVIDQYVDTELSLPIQMLLVNKERGIPSSYEPDRLTEPDVPFPFSDDRPKRYMSSEAAGQLGNMFDQAWNQGVELYAKSGYRSYDRQKELHDYYTRTYGEEYADRISAEPGHSEHQTGLAMDVTSAEIDYQLIEEFADTEEGQWVAENAADYGFIIRYPEGKEYMTGYKYEPWHLRYVGVRAAQYIDQQNWTLETYLR
ncbi:cell wall-binding repeat-containing protein [Bacillus salacetis]|uniref:cell wall-binding repeat-containing protein n=1 Tax=Bacillus salacetis TaxID=2315464 RepID=UPI003BA3859F